MTFFTGSGSCQITESRWTKLQVTLIKVSQKSVISTTTLMSSIGLLAPSEKKVLLGRMHMTFSVASQSSLEVPNVPEFSNPFDSENKTIEGVVVRSTKCAAMRIPMSQGSQCPNLYSRLKSRLGCISKSRFCRGHVVS